MQDTSGLFAAARHQTSPEAKAAKGEFDFQLWTDEIEAFVDDISSELSEIASMLGSAPAWKPSSHSQTEPTTSTATSDDSPTELEPQTDQLKNLKSRLANLNQGTATPSPDSLEEQGGKNDE